MKKLISYILIGFVLSSCSYNYNMSIYQNKNLKKFATKKRVRNSTHKHIRPGKRGYIQDNTVTKNSRRTLRRMINADRWTVSTY